MGDRPRELAEAVASIPAYPGVLHEVIVVANGCADPLVPAGTKVLELPENVGVPAGRNRGAEAAAGDVLVFLDDDAVVASPALAGLLMARFDAEPDLAVMSFRIADPETGETSRRHVPKLGSTNADASFEATSFLGGACAIRAAAFEAVGGLPDDFFYALEETDLAWRLIDAGWRVRYEADAVVHHPRTEIDRHGGATRLTARNRVLLARRRLPRPLVPVYLLTWTAITLLRGHSMKTLRDHWTGTREGLGRAVERDPMRWRTVWRLTRLGRPPII